MTKLNPYWRTEDKWVCLNHIPSIVHHKDISRCTMSNCNCERPILVKENVISNIIQSASLRCEYYKCSNQKQDGRKYCSDKCRKDRARELYRIRQKLKKKRQEEKLMKIKLLEEKIKLLKRA